MRLAGICSLAMRTGQASSTGITISLQHLPTSTEMSSSSFVPISWITHVLDIKCGGRRYGKGWNDYDEWQIYREACEMA
jgi:hypothetical protein